MSRLRMVAGLCLAAVLAGGDAFGAARLTGSVAEVLAAARDDDTIAVIIVMAETTDATLAEGSPRQVGARLKALAARSQRSLLAELNDHQPRGEASRLTRLPIINGLAVTATKRLLLEIATRPDVGYICADGRCRVPPVIPAPRGAGAPTQGVDWNISAVKADLAWQTLGLRGEGVVIGNIDTGADVLHPALAANYRGGTNSWFDAIGGLPEPYDDYGHGTATTGGVCGNDPAESFWGVAPQAQFIAAKAYDATGFGDHSDLLACAGWMLDPDGDSATDDMPEVVNNSWGGEQRDPWFMAAIEAWGAAGIYPVFAAGNSGPAPGSVVSPGDYPNVLAVGATTSSNVVAKWSSRGPATWMGVDYLKPNLVAPGSGVRVPRASGGYIPSVGGTSFACPHVAGAAALMFQKQPTLSHADATMLLENTATDLGPAGPDNDYGHGLLDVLAVLAGIPNADPRLTFAGTPGYESDGVEPDVADAATDITWKIKYSDANNDPPSGPVELHIQRGGLPVAGSPFEMAREGAADFVAGEVCTYTRRLARGDDYTYHFEASDGASAALGEGTIERAGPIVRNSPPVLSWLGTTGYVADGVRPQVGDPRATSFRFGVRYTDADGDPPTLIRARIERDGVVVRVLDLRTPRENPNYASGVAFYRRAEFGPGTYRYRFFARDGQTQAVGEPCGWQRGPILRLPPRLDWTGGVGYEADGVEPESGEPDSTIFEFRVKVSDTQGQAPGYVKVLLRRNGALWQELDMFPRAGGSDQKGRVYKRRARLMQGRYAYRFAAEDRQGTGVGPATQWQRWPFVRRTAASAAPVVTVTASTGETTAEITLVLSSAAAVTCRVLNVAGRPLRSVWVSRDCGAGIQRLAWDLRSAGGLPVPDGTYLVEAVARDAQGGEQRALSAITVRRR